MKKEFLPYYISRALLSALFSILVVGLSWEAVLLAMVFFGAFLFYLHSGWFRIDLSNPFFPLHRDFHGQLIQRKALIISVVISLLLYIVSSQLLGYLGVMLISGHVALSIGIIIYFVAQLILFVRA